MANFNSIGGDLYGNGGDLMNSKYNTTKSIIVGYNKKNNKPIFDVA